MFRIFTPFLAVIAWLPIHAAAASTPDETIPVESFAAAPLMEGPELSPSGTRYATSVAYQGQRVLGILPVKSDGPKAIWISVGERNDLYDWTWVNEDWLVVTLSTVTKVEGQDMRVWRAFGVSSRDDRVVPIVRDVLGQNAADLLWTAHDGTPRVLLGMQQSVYLDSLFYPEVFEVDVSNGHLASRAKPQDTVMRWYADGQGNVRIGIGYSDMYRSARLMYRDKNGELFRTKDRTGKGEADDLIVPRLFLEEPGRALTFDDHSGFNALYELNLETMQIGKEVHSVAGYDLSQIHTDESRSHLLGVTYADTRWRVDWRDPVLAKLQRDLDKVAGADGWATIETWNRDQTRFIVHLGSSATPGAYYYYDSDQRKLTHIGFANAALKDIRLSPMQVFRYKARDGLEIEAFLTFPVGKEPKHLPLIVLPHGGPSARDVEDWDWWVQYLAYMGYAVVQPNYRGSTGYGKAFKDKGDGQWGLAMQDDLLDAIAHLSTAGTIDAKRVCIVGASYGGYAALRGAQRDGTIYRCAVSYAGVADMPRMLQYDRRFLYGSSYNHHYRKAAPDLKGVSPSNFPEQFSVPVLLMHGKRDLTVPVAQSRLMAERLKRAGKNVRYVEQPQGDHHFTREEDRLEFLKEMTAFLHANNPP